MERCFPISFDASGSSESASRIPAPVARLEETCVEALRRDKKKNFAILTVVRPGGVVILVDFPWLTPAYSECDESGQNNCCRQTMVSPLLTSMRRTVWLGKASSVSRLIVKSPWVTGAVSSLGQYSVHLCCSMAGIRHAYQVLSHRASVQHLALLYRIGSHDNNTAWRKTHMVVSNVGQSPNEPALAYTLARKSFAKKKLLCSAYSPVKRYIRCGCQRSQSLRCDWH